MGSGGEYVELFQKDQSNLVLNQGHVYHVSFLDL